MPTLPAQASSKAQVPVTGVTPGGKTIPGLNKAEAKPPVSIGPMPPVKPMMPAMKPLMGNAMAKSMESFTPHMPGGTIPGGHMPSFKSSHQVTHSEGGRSFTRTRVSGLARIPHPRGIKLY